MKNYSEADDIGLQNTKEHSLTSPKPALRLIDAIVLITGIVIGAGIFRSPSVVAANTVDGYWFLFVWVLGGIISLIGALCYSELSAAFPSTGGDYHFLKLAFGKLFSFLFAWARIPIVQTGSIALLAFIIGDYMSQVYDLGKYTSSLYAVGVVILLTLINVLGIKFGTGIQKALSALQFAGIFIIVFTGFFIEPANSAMSVAEAYEPPVNPSLSLAFIFVLLTFGGWNEAAYISSELKAGSRKMSFVLIASLFIITVVYLLVNLAFLNVLGLEGIAASEAVGASMMQATLGQTGVVLIGLLVCLSALTSLNTTIFTGARSSYSFGKDFNRFSFLGKWNNKKSAPVNSLLAQGGIAILLIVFGAFARNGFEAMVDFTAPVFWFFFLCTGIGLIILRQKKPDAPRPFKVPLYPFTPIVFIGFSAYLLYSSLMVTVIGSLLGVSILLLGLLVYFFSIKKEYKKDVI